MSAIDTDRFRERLLEERARVEAAIQYLREEHPGSLEEEIEESVGTSDNHPGDSATATLDREIDYTLEENSEQVLSEIDDALRRIEAGTFGTCRTCEQPIAPERLEAMPWATQCIDCKRKAERG
ncbi:MAG: TraR/DksA C4-type zinc finger protein [Actinomycetota bacterium]|nr:TraR/DksA C4-type zinc finger protein [Actinomycetota bacterium]